MPPLISDMHSECAIIIADNYTKLHTTKNYYLSTYVYIHTEKYRTPPACLSQNRDLATCTCINVITDYGDDSDCHYSCGQSAPQGLPLHNCCIPTTWCLYLQVYTAVHAVCWEGGLHSGTNTLTTSPPARARTHCAAVTPLCVSSGSRPPLPSPPPTLQEFQS